MKSSIIYIIIFLLNLSVSFGHVGINYPIENSEFTSGSSVIIQWYIAIDHGDCDWDIYFSTDNGNSWSIIEENLHKSQLTYAWTVPNIQTTLGKIKVVQDNSLAADYDAVSGRFSISLGTTDIIHENIQANEFFLSPAYPNPFNSSTVISFNLPQQEYVQLNIYSISGERIKTLVNTEMSAGFHQATWNADEVTSGVYFFSIETKNFLQSRKVILMK